MDQYSLTDDERELAALVREFADEVVAPKSYEADRTKTLPLDVVAQMGELGLFGLPFPEEFGGQGGDYFALCLAIEATRPGRPVPRDHARGGRQPRRHAGLPLRHRRAEAAAAP